ncbi:serine acetyltransferase [Lacinutrix neustonica]|uniref:Serine acetyltransferase n=1 Tax=Lacinutrix neustonica TaxID=2980107 RepID=A0A9E8MUT1_9FLAO|nr:serine acetyltransferase [Lacinutrix neustonica]WAC01957.1 serine acetyltransferase [Lacinutrix neustonica]
MNLFSLIASDYKKYSTYGGHFFSIFFFTQGFWAVFQYRVAHWCYTLKVPVVKQVLLLVCLFWQKCIEMLTGISIPYSVTIGHSFYIGHFGGIIINSNSVIGNNCNISQGVTIGVSGRDEKRGVPIIGNHVYIGANAVIAGKITVGDAALVGANSLVIDSVESGVTVLGVPAKVISNNSSKGYI